MGTFARKLQMALALRKLQFITFFLLIIFTSCGDQKDLLALNETPEAPVEIKARPLSADFKNYWYAGEAEITSYDLQQARYGELREGKAVMIYVTEPFVPGKQVKADRSDPDNISVLKLNTTKNFLTGIYPYSLMSSTFYPVEDNQHAIKVTSSIQEWCGQVFAQLNNRERFEVSSFSYFESEGDQRLELDKVALENEIWTRIRINPENLPVGELEMLPALDYLRLLHKPVKAYRVSARLQQNGDHYDYRLVYPELDRILEITFTADFPHSIESWEETYPSGFGSSARRLRTKATKINSIKTPYWRKNGIEDVSLRDTLGI